MDPDEQPKPEPPPAKEWVLQPQSEYRFELDPDMTLAVEVGFLCDTSCSVGSLV